MSSIGVQIQRRKKGRYVSIIECFTDPVTGKRTSRTIKPFGYVEKDLEEDPDFMAKVYAECDQLRVDRAEAKWLRERQDMRLRPERTVRRGFASTATRCSAGFGRSSVSPGSSERPAAAARLASTWISTPSAPRRP